MTFRQNGQYNGIVGKTVPFLTLRDDVIEGSPHPNLNGYQQCTPGGACSAKGTFATHYPIAIRGTAGNWAPDFSYSSGAEDAQQK